MNTFWSGNWIVSVKKYSRPGSKTQHWTYSVPAKNFAILESFLIPFCWISSFLIPCVFSIAMIQDCEHLLGPMTYNEWTPDPTKASLTTEVTPGAVAVEGSTFQTEEEKRDCLIPRGTPHGPFPHSISSIGFVKHAPRGV